MKKVLLTICAIAIFAISANAQFHVELGLNFNSPTGDFGDFYELGVGGYLEPKYAFNENIDLGLYVGVNGFAGADVDTGFGTASVDATSVTPILATGTYRFLTNKVTPYAGLGLGVYLTESVGVDSSGGTTDETVSEFGFAPRAGVYIGRMNLGLVYNSAGDISFLQFNLGVRILGRD